MAGIRTTIRNEVTLDNASLQRVAGQISSQLRRSVSIDGRQFESISRPLGKITGQADEFTKSLEASNARVLAFGASVAIINGVSQAFSQLIENTIRVEKTLADINVVLGGTTKQLNQFKDAIFETAKNTAQSFDTVAEGALEFARQGLSMEESIKRINDALILTRLTGIDVTSAVQGLTAAVNAFAKEGLSTTEIINKLSAVDVAFAVSSEDLINSLSRASSVANDAGVSFDELIAITAALQETTARGGAVIGNALKSIFTRIQRPATLSSLQELGIAIQDLEGNILPATKLLEGLAGKVDQLSDIQRSQIFGEVAGLFQINQLIAAVSDLGSANSKTAKAIQVSASATDEAYRKNEQLNTTLSALLSQTGTGIEQLFSRIGEIGLTDDLKTIVGGFANVIEFLNKALSEDEGNKIAKGFIKGIGGALTSAPFLGLLAAIFLKLTASFVKFGIDGLKSFLGLNKAAKQQEALQASILNILLQEPAILKQLEVSTLSRKDKENLLLQVLKQQTAEYQKIATLAASITPGLYRAGARTGPTGVTAPTSAGGYIPAFAKENRDIAMGVGGAKPSDKSVLIPNFSFGRGKKGPMVANTGEYIVPNYAMGGDAIFNRDMVDKIGMPKGAMKINAAGGYIPNFAGPTKIGAEQLREIYNPYFLNKRRKITTEEIDNINESLIRSPLSPFGYRRDVDGKPTKSIIDGSGRVASPAQIVSALKSTKAIQEREDILKRQNLQKLSVAERRKKLGYAANPMEYAMITAQRNMPKIKLEKFNYKGTGQNKKFSGEYGYLKVGLNEEASIKAKVKNDEELDKDTKEFAILKSKEQALALTGGTPNPKFTEKLLNKGAISGLSGSIFETAISSVLNSSDFDISESNNRTFDFKGLRANTKLARLFNIPTSATKIEAKIRDSSSSRESMRNKILTDVGVKTNASLGYIPNFAQSPLEDAIAREQAAGVPINQIRVNQNGKLRNSQNPMGLAVTNTRDEPTGAIPNFAARSSSSNNNNNPKENQDSSGALEKIFVLQTVAAGLTQAFSSTSEEATTLGQKLSIFGTEVTSAVLSLSLLKAQAGQVGLGQLLGFGGGGKKGPWNAGLKKSAVTGAGFGWNAAGAQAYRAQNPTGIFKFLPKLGGFGKLITTVGANFTKFLPAIGQAIFAFQILNSAVKAVFGKSIIQAILDPFRDKTKLAAESLGKLSKSAVEAASKGSKGLSSIIERIEREQEGRKEKGGDLTEEDTSKISREQDLSTRAKALFGENGIRSDILGGIISNIEAEISAGSGTSSSFRTIDIGDEKVGVFAAGKIKKFLEKTEEETSLNIQELAINLSEFLKQSGASESQLKQIQDAYNSGVEKFSNSIIEASTKKLSDEELQTEVENAYKEFITGFRDVSEPIEDSLKQAIAVTEAEKRIFATDFARSIRELYFSANLNSEKDLFDKVSSIRRRLADQTISETERFYLQRSADEEEFSQKQEAARRQSEQKVIDAYLADIQAVQTLPAETAQTALDQLTKIQEQFSNREIDYAEAQKQAQAAVSTALGAGAANGENLLNAQQEAAQQERTLKFEKEKFKAGQDNQLIERNTREEREKSLRILTQQLDAQRRLNEASRDLTKAKATSATEIQIERLKAQLSDPTLGEAARRTLELELSKAEIKLQGIQFEQNAIDTLRSQFTDAIQPSIDNLVENLEGDKTFFNPELAKKQYFELDKDGNFAISNIDLGIEKEKATEEQKQAERNRLQAIFNTFLKDQVPLIVSGQKKLEDVIPILEKQLGIGKLNTEELKTFIALLGISKAKQDAIIAAQLAAEKIRQGEEDLAGQGKFFQIGLERAKRNLFQSKEDFRTEIAQKIPESFANNLSQALVDAANGTKKLKDALIDAAQSFLSMIQQAFMQRAVNQLVGAFLPGDTTTPTTTTTTTTTTTPTTKAPTNGASGGYISGGSGVRDDVPAMLMAGEYVIKKDAVKKYGVGFLSNLNQKALPKMQEGGFFLPGTRGQGDIKGRKNLEEFAYQRITSGLQDQITSTRGGASIDLETQSKRLTSFGRTRENSPIFQQLLEKQLEAQGLLDQQAQYKKQREEQRKQALKQVGITALGAVASAGLAKWTQSLSDSGALSKFASKVKYPFQKFGEWGKGAFSKVSSFFGGANTPSATIASGTTSSSTDAGYGMGGNPDYEDPTLANGRFIKSPSRAMVMGGEFVVGRQAVEQYGKNYFDSINNMTAPGPRFAMGGAVNSGQNQPSVSSSGDTNITINVTSENKSDTQTDNKSDESSSKLAEKIRKEVVRVIEEEKRISGSLSSRKRGV